MSHVSRVELFSILKKFDWELVRERGTHAIFQRHGRTERVAIGSTGMDAGGLKEIYKRFGITTTDNGNKPVLKRRRINPKDVSTIPEEGTFGRRIYDARTAIGMSQSDLARHIGLTQSPVSTWERNVATPFNKHGGISYKTTRAALGKMAELFGTSWDDIALKAGVTRTLRRVDPDPLLPEPEPEPEAEAEGPEPFTKLPDAATRLGHDAKDFISLIRPADVMQAMVELENRILSLERELGRIRRTDVGVIRWKADAYDRIKAIINAEEEQE